MTIHHTANSAALYARALRVMPGGNTRTTVFAKPHPLYARRGSGCRVIDVDGVERIDLIGNFTSLIHGHAHPALVAAAMEQIGQGTCFGMPTESEIALAEILCARLPSAEQVRFANSGTEAVMTAIKAARAATGRPKIAKCEGAYHGTYDPAETSQNASPETWGLAAAPASVPTAAGTPRGVLDDVVVLPFNRPVIATALLRAHGSQIAAVLVDPMPNRAGLVPATAEYIQALRAATREIGALLIFDEVITFRLGFHGAQGRFGVQPDLTTLGKFIGGGFPVGAVVGPASVMAVFDPSAGEPPVPHGGTFSANPITMTAGAASMRLLTPEAFAHLEELGERLAAGIRDRMAHHGVDGQVTGLGSLRRVHMKSTPLSDFRSTFPSADEKRRLAALWRALLDRGVMVAPTGLMALSTPMTGADVDEAIGAFDEALALDAVRH
jgi:glutamate-1-semialdehyde 2,1-aminomutase